MLNSSQCFLSSNAGQSENDGSWDLSSLYRDLSDPEIDSHFTMLDADLEEIRILVKGLLSGEQNGDFHSSGISTDFVSLISSACVKIEKSLTLAEHLYFFAFLHLSTDGKNSQAKALRNKAQTILTSLDEEKVILTTLLTRAPEPFLTALLSVPEMKPFEFSLVHRRQLRDTLLTVPEEKLLASLSESGFQAWGNLYFTLASSMDCKFSDNSTQKMSLAEATQLLYSAEETVRKEAYLSIHGSWAQQGDTCAAILNSLAGWRRAEDKKRSHTKTVHFLDRALHENRIQRKTLEAMFSVVSEAKDLGQKCNRLRAHLLGKDKLDPWDLQAAPPLQLSKESSSLYSLGEAMEIVGNALGKIDPEVADFINHLVQKRWIETGTEGNRRVGAYCVLLPQIGQTRVYVPFAGGIGHIKTLAHELGHAFHNSVMFDLPTVEQLYPSTLAETASLFMETSVLNELVSQCDIPSERLKMLWTEAGMASNHLLNIPCRYDFEYRFHEQSETRSFSAEDFSALMTEVWQEWYGDTLSQMDDLLWCSKIHFYKTDQRFYNFPYTFGYLFSLALLGFQEEDRESFFPKFKELLKNTGRMTVEDLVSKYLGEDISSANFWRKSLLSLEKKAQDFERTLALNSSVLE